MNKLKITLHKCTYLSLCLFLLCTIFILPAFAAPQTKVVRVGWFEDLYNNISKNGERSGYAYEYCQTISGYTGWSYEYVRGDWDELQEKLQRGEIDIMASVSYTDERAQGMLFSEMPMGHEKYYLYAKLSHTGISSTDLSTLNGKRIAILAGSVQIPQFEHWKTQFNLHIQNVYITGADDFNRKLIKNEVDGLISTETPLWTKLGLTPIAITGSSGIYFVINKNRPDLKQELDTAMRKIEYDKPFYVDELYKRYYPAVSSAILANEEKNWLTQHGTIRIGYFKNDSSFSSLDKDTGKLLGVINDYIKFAATSLGNQPLQFEPIGFTSQEEGVQALKEHRIDMLFHFSQNPYGAEQNGFILSNTVLTFPLSILTTQDYFNEDANNVIAIEKKNMILKWHLRSSYPNWKFKEYDTPEEVENAVRQHQADGFVPRATQLSHYSEDKQLHSVFLSQPGTLAFAVNREDTLLLSILNKTLKTMPSTMLTSALSMHNNAAKKMTVVDFIRENKLLVGLFVLVLLLILEILRRSRASEAKAKQTAEQLQQLNTQLETSHDTIQAALRQAETANAAKTNFLFNMSHDIRTPMNALLGYTELLKEELHEPNMLKCGKKLQQYDKLLQYQQKMEQSGKLLLSILNNVLDMARIESGKVELNNNYFKIGTLMREMCDVFEVTAKEKGISLSVKTEVEHKHIMCDLTKLKEIFSNLISNALKYTPPGGSISLHTQELPYDKDGYVLIRTTVTDTGIGMSKEYLPTLFDAFSRERNTTMSKVAGTGLGMAIVKKLVEMMDGTIEVESKLGKGTKFTVTIPHQVADASYYEEQEEAAKHSNNKELLQGKHVLMAEDNDLNAEIAIFLLQKMGLFVDRVEDGVQCVDKLGKQPAGSYDLILMDIQMPNMDGYKATQAIRRFEDKAKANIPIIAMTANAFDEDKRNAFNAGMNGHIAKPINVAKVEQTLCAILHDNTQA